MAPIHRGAQRPLALARRARPARQQPEAIREPLDELLDREHPQPRRGQLDRQRQPVQPHAERFDGRRVVVGQREARTRLARALDEQRHRVRPPSPGSDSGGTRQSVSPSTPSGARLVASTTTCGAARSSAVTTSRARAQQMLAVVEHDQRPPRRQVRARRLQIGHARQRPHAQRLGHRRAHQRLVSQRRQLDPPDPVRERIDQRRTRPAARAASCRTRPRPSPSTTASTANASRSAASSRSRPTKLVSATGRLLAGAALGSSASGHPRAICAPSARPASLARAATPASSASAAAATAPKTSARV